MVQNISSNDHSCFFVVVFVILVCWCVCVCVYVRAPKDMAHIEFLMALASIGELRDGKPPFFPNDDGGC